MESNTRAAHLSSPYKLPIKFVHFAYLLPATMRYTVLTFLMPPRPQWLCKPQYAGADADKKANLHQGGPHG